MWTSRRAISLHVALIVFVPGCVALTWWQVSRALGGNTLSWVYTFEWPLFGAYAVYMWWRLVHDVPGARPAPDAEPSPDAEAAAHAGSRAGEVAREDPDDELAAYNRYLAELNASGRRKRW
jgi:DNA-binding transcriptional regulator of glucitol operon